MTTFKTRLSQLERETLKAALAALDLVDVIPTKGQAAALLAWLDWRTGQGLEPDAETQALAQEAAAAMWAAASSLERALLWTWLPLPEAAE